MKATLLLIMAVALVGCVMTPEAVSNNLESKPIFDLNDWHQGKIEEQIRRGIKKFEGELTKSDLEKVTEFRLDGIKLIDVSALARLTKLEKLFLSGNNLTDLSALEGLAHLEMLALFSNPDLTIHEIAKLQKALPKCKILHNAKK